MSSIRSRASAKESSTTTTTTAASMSSAHNIHSNGTIHSIRPVTESSTFNNEGEEADETTPIIGSGGHESICTWDELPAWMKDNPAILTGYRRQNFSYKKCAASLGFLHNESVNVWSHLLGAVACIIVAPLAYFKIFLTLETIHWTDIMHFYIFMAGAILCLSMSALFHLFHCHSETVSHHWNRCDYVGIVFLISGSFYPAVFYGFYCFRTFQIMYIAMISIFGGATVIAVTKPIFRTPQYRWIRSCLFCAMGLSAVFPIIHGLVLYGVQLARKAIALDHMILMGFFYVFGAILYGTRTPERFFPGKFDHFGSSHQIFHICVLLGVLTHFLGVTKAMAFWHDSNHTCSIPIEEMRASFL